MEAFAFENCFRVLSGSCKKAENHINYLMQFGSTTVVVSSL